MSFLKICGLAIMQGLTEFLPVSSSGHLLLLQHFAGMKASPGSPRLALHGGTLLSILVFYRKIAGIAIRGVAAKRSRCCIVPRFLCPASLLQ